jgi:cysteinyl-tRNA synthetase
MDEIFGLGLNKVSSGDESDSDESNINEDLAKMVEAQIEARNLARKNRDFTQADRIRDELKDQGILLIDTPQGTTWKTAEEKL